MRSEPKVLRIVAPGVPACEEDIDRGRDIDEEALPVPGRVVPGPGELMAQREGRIAVSEEHIVDQGRSRIGDTGRLTHGEHHVQRAGAGQGGGAGRDGLPAGALGVDHRDHAAPAAAGLALVADQNHGGPGPRRLTGRNAHRGAHQKLAPCRHRQALRASGAVGVVASPVVGQADRARGRVAPRILRDPDGGAAEIVAPAAQVGAEIGIDEQIGRNGQGRRKESEKAKDSGKRQWCGNLGGGIQARCRTTQTRAPRGQDPPGLSRTPPASRARAIGASPPPRSARPAGPGGRAR